MTTPLAHDGQVVWYFLPTVADISEPTVAEVAAGVRILKIVNYVTPSSEAEVDTSTVDSTYDTTVIGTSKAGPVVLTMQRLESGNEAASWGAFSFRANGFLLKTLTGPAVAAAKCAVYPVQVGRRQPAGYGKNNTQNFDVSFAVTSDPDIDAAVVA